ncbi:AAA family ATPase [Pontibacter toksunensis]|uniref:AAA family ATPase n=1 Tax=Pontibacter toksunensis TaxID=1332631 RepID=A0ABW6C2J8_9BACT
MILKNTIAVGDIIIVKKGIRELLGYGEVTSDYYYDNTRDSFQKCRNVQWVKKGNWPVDHALVQKTLTDITKYPADEHPEFEKYYEWLLSYMKDNGSTLPQVTHPLNTIFYGPPGTGKTYTTLLRAAEIIENRPVEDYEEAMKIFNDNLGERIEFITFHQNYSYEDFIQGLRPDTDNGAELSFNKVDGVFKRIADRGLKNLNLSKKGPEEVSRELLFEKALERFIEEVQEGEENFKINETASIIEVEEEAFRYIGEKWTRISNGNRMKFSDLREFDRNSVTSGQDVKKLKTISGLANQHATYYFKVYQSILKHIPRDAEVPAAVKKQNYVIIIDEINRANISRVFGELITLIEPDKRSHGAIPLRCTLPSGEEFVVPSNLYIIGTMNTADKSIALLDIALRRRFEFEAMYPKYQLDGQEVHDTDVLEKINKKVIELKGHDFQIGHAYFMGENSNLVERMNKKVIPLLLEYFINDEKEVKSILVNAGLEAEDNTWPLRIRGKRA